MKNGPDKQQKKQNRPLDPLLSGRLRLGRGMRGQVFKRKVIDSSVAQINAHTDITTSYTQRKTGRNVTHLNFKIDAKESVPKAVKRPSLTRAYVEKHALPGESWEAARARA